MKSKWQKGSAAGWVVLVIILLCIIGFLIWWFGFNNSGTMTPTNTTQSNQPTAAQEQAAIKDNWMTFFSGQTPADRKAALLQNGQQYKQVIEQQSQSATAKATSATVSSVGLNGATTATVTYTIAINGKPTLKDQTGQAVKENGVWKVSDAAFCSLLQLSGNVPPNCPGASNSTNSSNSGSSQTQTQNSTQSPSSGQ